MRLVVLVKSADVPPEPKGRRKVGVVMREFKAGKLHSGSKKGPKIKSRSQALAVALSEQRKVDKSTAK